MHNNIEVAYKEVKRESNSIMSYFTEIITATGRDN